MISNNLCGTCGSKNLRTNISNTVCGDYQDKECRDCGAYFCQFENRWSGGNATKGVIAQYPTAAQIEKWHVEHPE